jgi:hypothetical protein
MDFRDEYEQLTGVPAGYNAFQVAQWPDTRPTRSKAAQAAHEKQVAAKREAKLARKNVSTFNTQIPDQAASDRTNSIKFGTSPKAKTRISAT